MEKKINEKLNKLCEDICCTKINNFSVKIGNTEILDNINLHIHCGELTCIVGPNGAGKSTLLKAILGEINHTGTLEYQGTLKSKNYSPIIGYVPQYLNFDLTTPCSVLDLFRASKSNIPAWFKPSSKIKEEVLSQLSKVNAEHLIDRRLGALSGGELQRVLLALALDPIPNLLLLDEPVSGMDQKGLKMFYDTLIDLKNKYDLSIILVSHDLGLVSKYADRVVLLNRSILCHGTPYQVFSNEITKNIFGFLNINSDSKGGL